MKRALPACAWCGGSLREPSGHVLIELRERGSPRFGWHIEKCSRQDDIARDYFAAQRVLADAGKRTLDRLLEREVKRGQGWPSCVSAPLSWWSARSARQLRALDAP